MPPQEESDFELLEAWRSGDNKSGKELFRRHFDGIYRFFRNKVDEAAEDLTQQTFLGCVKGQHQYRGDASFRTYLFSIARYRLYSYLRDRKRSQARFSPAETSVADLGAVSPTSIVASKEEHRLLLTAMRRLPIEMQVALELHYWEDMTVAEIAEITETPSGTIKRRLQRARARLDVLLGELAESPELHRSATDNFELWAGQLKQMIQAPTPPGEN